MDIKQIGTKKLTACIAALEDAKERRDGGLLVTEQYTLNSMRLELSFRQTTEWLVADLRKATDNRECQLIRRKEFVQACHLALAAWMLDKGF